MTFKLRNATTLAALCCLALAAGCNNASSQATSASGNAPATPPAGSSPATPGEGSTPAAASAAAEDPKLQELEAKLKENPSDEAVKKELAEATYQVGHTMMLNPELPPRVKYRGALKHFRRVLELDPKHEKAAAEKKTIEDIYQSMGMPIPQ